MKNYYLLLLLLFSVILIAQPPANYYNSANGFTGYALKTKLKVIIKTGHTDEGYGSLWSLYGNTAFRDNIYENDNTILDIYSENPTGNDPYEFTYSSNQCGEYANEGDCYNREHLVPQAYFDNVAIPNGEVNPKHDPHHVIPTDGKVNGVRDNFPFGKVNNASYTTGNGSQKGSNLNSGYSAGYSGTVFEPIDEFKGDVARALLYFATRYEDQMDEFYNSATVQSKAMFDGSINHVFSPTFLNILLTWNTIDPVSTKEMARNNAIYNYQGNRNPFVDNNSYVTAIWGLPLGISTIDVFSEVAVYPNPSNNHMLNVHTTAAIDVIHLIAINGQLLQQIKNPILVNGTYTLTNLPQGFYFLKLTSQNQSITKKVIVN